MTEYYILRENISERNESAEEENEEEKFQLFFIFLSHGLKMLGRNKPYRKGYIFFIL